ncbi:hypothetical protein Taro_053946, partial [Colocasia esculenta]|nr:hypothetical protein [Colocasia esculenta]
IRKSEGDSHLVAFTRHRQSRTDTKNACHICQTASGATRWEGDIGYVAFKKATYPIHVAFKKATYSMSPSIKPEGDSGYVVFKKATYSLSQSQAEPDIDMIGTTSRQSPCRDPEDGARGPRGPGCYTTCEALERPAHLRRDSIPSEFAPVPLLHQEGGSLKLSQSWDLLLFQGLVEDMASSKRMAPNEEREGKPQSGGAPDQEGEGGMMAPRPQCAFEEWHFFFRDR